MNEMFQPFKIQFSSKTQDIPHQQPILAGTGNNLHCYGKETV